MIVFMVTVNTLIAVCTLVHGGMQFRRFHPTAKRERNFGAFAASQYVAGRFRAQVAIIHVRKVPGVFH